MSTETDLALLKQEIAGALELFNKIDVSLSKYNDLFATTNRLLAIHEERLASSEKSSQVIERRVDSLNQHLADDMKELQNKLISITKDVSEEVHNTERHIVEEVQTIKENLSNSIVLEHKDSETHIKTLETRIQSLEKWRWVIVGGAAIVGYLIDKFTPFSFFTINK